MLDASTIADRLRELRLVKGWSRKELADHAGMKQAGIRDIEQGINSPRWTSVIALANALGVGVEEFTKPANQVFEKGRGRPRKEEQEE